MSLLFSFRVLAKLLLTFVCSANLAIAVAVTPKSDALNDASSTNAVGIAGVGGHAGRFRQTS
jgi:hypothetical protein